MKFFLCSDLRVGMNCAENLSVELAHKWAQAVTDKLAGLMMRAVNSDADCALFPGRVFGAEHVPEAAVDALFEAVRKAGDLPVILCPDDNTFLRLKNRKDRPDNLRLLNDEGEQKLFVSRGIFSRTPDYIQIEVPSENAEVELKDVAGTFFDGAVRIPSFEPSGWTEAEEGLFGYAVLETAQGTHKTWCTEDTLFAYKIAKVTIEPEDSADAIREKTGKAIAGADEMTFVRLFLNGRTAFGTTADTEGLRESMQGQVFSAEIFDDTTMEINERALESDISLQSEFVRLVLQDESLSDSERSRLITCGWNALNGKEAPGK